MLDIRILVNVPLSFVAVSCEPVVNSFRLEVSIIVENKAGIYDKW